MKYYYIIMWHVYYIIWDMYMILLAVLSILCIKPGYKWWLECHSTFLSIKYFWLGGRPADENMTISLTDCMSYRPTTVKMIVARRDGDVESPATRFSTFFMAPASQHPRGCYLRASFYFTSCSSSSSFFSFFLYSPFKLPVSFLSRV